MAIKRSLFILSLALIVLQAAFSFTPAPDYRRVSWISPRLSRHQQNHQYVLTNRQQRQQHVTTTKGVASDVFLSIDERLHQSLSVEDNEAFVVEGYVNAKRSFGSALSFVDLLIHTRTNDHSKSATNSYNCVDICQALLRLEHYDTDTCPYYDGYRKCLLPGTLLRLEGVAAPTRNPGEAVLLVKRIQLLQVPRQPQHIAAILALAASGDLPMQEVAYAALVASLDVETLKKAILERSLMNTGGTYKTYRSLAKVICSELPTLPKEVIGHMGKQRPPIPGHLVQPPTEVSSLLKDSACAVSKTLSVDAAKKQLETSATTATSTVVAVMGVVQNRRRFQGNLTIVNLVDEITPLSKDTDDVGVVDMRRLESVLHPDVLDVSDIYGNLLSVGSHVWVSGILVQEIGQNGRSKSVILWIMQARLVRASWRPMTLRYVLDLLYDGVLEADEAAEALQVTIAEAQQLAEMDDLTARQWKANELSTKLQSTTTRMSNLAPEVLEVLEGYQDLRKKWRLQPPVPIPVVAAPLPSLLDDSTLLKPTTTLLPKSLPGSNWQRKKRPQLEWMVQEICTVAKAHPEFGLRTLHILDIGGGKGKLANYLAQSLGPEFVQVHVVDIAAGAIANGAMRAKRLRVENVQYQVADASRFIPKEQRMDMVVALHACGHLSDVALAHAVQNDAFGFVICPCCFSSNPHLRVPTTSNSTHDLLRQQQTTVEDFLNITPPAWSALKSVAEVQGDATLASQGIHTICAVRAEAVSKQVASSVSSNDDNSIMHIDIKSFPIQYSTRNICLVGAKRKTRTVNLPKAERPGE